MNDRAREVLVEAALSGTQQIRGTFQDDRGGFCAMGVLLHVLGDIQVDNLSCDWLFRIKKAYDIDSEEVHSIVQANDKKQWDFLTIARKIGVQDDVA